MEFSLGSIVRIMCALYIARVLIKGYKVLRVAKELNMLTNTFEFWLYFFASVFIGLPVHFNLHTDLKKAEFVSTVKTKGSILENILNHYKVESPARHPLLVAEDTSEAALQDRIIFSRWVSIQIREKYRSHIVPFLQKSLSKWNDSTEELLMSNIVDSVARMYYVMVLDASPDCVLALEKITSFMYNANYKRWVGPFGPLIAVIPAFFEKHIPSGRAVQYAWEFVGAVPEPFLQEQKLMHSNGRRVLFSMWSENTKRDKKHVDYEFSNFIALGIGANFISSPQNIYTMIFCMASCKEFQEKAYEELYSKIEGDPKNLSVELLFKLKYLDSFVKEILRFRSPISGQPRVYNGVELNINLYRILHDPKNFYRPHLFIPDRFMDSDQPRNPAYEPFGFGPRACAGQLWVSMSYRTTLAILLLTYKIELQPESAHMALNDLELHVNLQTYWLGGEKWTELGKHIALNKRTPKNSLSLTSTPAFQ